MVKSNAQRQAEYQRRQKEAGSYRLDAYISPDAQAALQQVVQRDGISRKDALERLIFNEAKGRNMQSQFRRDDPATDPGASHSTSKPARATIRLTADQAAEVEQLKTKLLKEHLDARKPVSQPAAQKASSVTTQQKPAGLTADDLADLEQFKMKLIGDRLDAREVQANGGSAGVAHKARVNAMLDAINQHRQK